MIDRKEYMTILKEWQNKQVIKVITGIRRTGKSTLLAMFQDHLKETGVENDRIISINFEDMEYEDLLDYRKLYAYIKERIIPDTPMYIFLDEVQKVESYENVVDSFYVQDNIDIYITGSNSHLFSGQLATNLRGRYIEINVLPLSFREYFSLTDTPVSSAFAQYMRTGGFPYINTMDLSSENSSMYIEGIYNTVLLKDIEDRLRRKESSGKNSSVTDVALLKSVSKYLSSVIGSPVSLRSITNYMISNERKVSINTISDYVTALCDAYLYYPVDPMDLNGKEVLKSNKKYYIVDLGLRNYILPKRNYDLGFSLENIVYFELLRRRYEVHIGRHGSQEIDFIAKRNNEYTYIQVTAGMTEEPTFNREILPLKNIRDNYEKVILTLDEYTPGNYDGIKVVNVLDWLINVH